MPPPQGTVCPHPRDSMPPSWGQRATTPGPGCPHSRDGVMCLWGPRSPWGQGDTSTPYSAVRGVPGGAAFGGVGDIPGCRDNAWGRGCKRAPGPAAPARPGLVPVLAMVAGAGARPPAPVALGGSPQVPPQPRRAQGGAAVPGPAVPGVPGPILGAGGGPTARLWHCPPGVRSAGPAGRLKVLARTGGPAGLFAK